MRNELAMHAGAEVEVCPICGGTAGNRMPDGGHYLCQEFKKMNRLDLIKKISACPDCNGTKTSRTAPILGNVFLPLDISQASIDAAFPPCETCGRKGSVGG